jgi:galactokinase/mevalonate kinase-like predicted kinase
MLFAYENPPGTREISGSQDSIGIVYPGLNRLDYNGEYWPNQITSVDDEEILRWLEERLHLVTLGPRKSDFRVRKDARITPARVRALAAAADGCWQAILARNEKEFGRQMRASFEAQISMFSRMMDHNARTAIKQYAGKSIGWKLSGAGGGGYLVLVSQRAIPGTIQIKIRRKDF